MELLRKKEAPSRYVILFDIQMPRMNGLEFLEAIRGEEVLSHSVIFVPTTFNAEKDVTASYQQQIAGYFVKGEAGDSFIGVVNLLDSCSFPNFLTSSEELANSMSFCCFRGGRALANCARSDRAGTGGI